MRGTPGLAALVFVVWVPLLFNGLSICSENKIKCQDVVWSKVVALVESFPTLCRMPCEDK
jgi:hypothetical protein